MKQQSDRQKARLDEYFEQANQDAPLQRCAVCGEMGSKDCLERHHVQRRKGDNLFVYIYLHTRCHRDVETFGRWARENGFIVDDFSTEQRFHNIGPKDNMLK